MWVLQHKDFGLGNFINLTPTLQAIHKLTGKLVPVYFESGYVQEAFQGCPFITHLKEPLEGKPIFTSGLINKKIPDWHFVYQYVRSNIFHELPEKMEFHTWVLNLKTAVILNGCASTVKDHTKKVDSETLSIIAIMLHNQGFAVKYVGLTSDFGFPPCNKSMHAALLEIDRCHIVVGNDTGLMHAAGAMKKKCFVMWKDTILEKNKSPNPNAFYSMKGNWIEDFKVWIENV